MGEYWTWGQYCLIFSGKSDGQGLLGPSRRLIGVGVLVLSCNELAYAELVKTTPVGRLFMLD